MHFNSLLKVYLYLWHKAATKQESVVNRTQIFNCKFYLILVKSEVWWVKNWMNFAKISRPRAMNCITSKQVSLVKCQGNDLQLYETLYFMIGTLYRECKISRTTIKVKGREREFDFTWMIDKAGK